MGVCVSQFSVDARSTHKIDGKNVNGNHAIQRNKWPTDGNENIVRDKHYLIMSFIYGKD